MRYAFDEYAVCVQRWLRVYLFIFTLVLLLT